MAPVTFTTRASLVAGTPENIGDVTDCLDKLLAGVNSVSDSQLASPTGGVWRTIHETPFAIIGSLAAGTYWFRANGDAIASASASSNLAVSFLFIDTTAYAVTGKTTQLRLNVNGLSSVSIGQTPTFGLYPIASLSNVSAAVALTLGTVLPGSTAAVAPVANTGSAPGLSAAFAVPTVSTGCIFGASLPGTTTASSLFTGSIRLELSYT